MAVKTTYRLIDDIDPDRTDDVRAVRISYGDNTFELHLSQTNRDAFEEILRPWLSKARVISTRKQGRRLARGTGIQSFIRSWAQSNGVPVGDRGALSADTITAYSLAHVNQGITEADPDNKNLGTYALDNDALDTWARSHGHGSGPYMPEVLIEYGKHLAKG